MVIHVAACQMAAVYGVSRVSIFGYMRLDVVVTPLQYLKLQNLKKMMTR
jgi:hypothetical protein